MEEVSLDGDLQPIEGILLLSISARKESLNSIGELLSFFNNSRLSMAQNKEVFTTTNGNQEGANNFADVKGE